MSEHDSSPWQPQPAGTAWIADRVEHLRGLHPDVVPFERRLREETGGRLLDWIDHLCLTDITGIEEAGFVKAADGWYEHPGALLPPVRSADQNRMLLRVDSVSDFVIANSHRHELTMDGTPGDPRRTALWARGQAALEFGVVEQKGCNARSSVTPLSDQEKLRRLEVREQLRHRRRKFANLAEAFRLTRAAVQQAIDAIGRDPACELFFAGERDYWQARNRAGRVQFMRQNALGLGWGNHDHHTYRSSRAAFADLMALLELLGFHCRERFYAGREAGWGAQALEQPVCRVVIFADVDLSPDEVSEDFAHAPLPPRNELGTIGLWCALHGESLFEAGMHHLECQFDYDGARAQLEAMGVNSMKPFTNFPFLRQCFTEGERWDVNPARIERIFREGLITREQADQFASSGAIGSHLEILERNDGYRGFNQTGINEIIRKTDPRLASLVD